MSTGGLALSGVFVLGSALVVPAWRNKHRTGAHAGAVGALSLLALVAAGAATTWLTWQVVSLGVHDSPQQSHGHSLLGSIFGVPVIVLPLAILVAVVGVAELVARTAGTAPVSSASAAQPPTSTAVSIERRSPDVRAQYPHELAGTPPRQPQTAQREVSGPRGRFRHLSRGDDRTLETIRGEVAAAGVHSRAALAEAVSQIESRLSIGLAEHARAQTSTQDAVGLLQQTVTDSAMTVTLALERVAEGCAKVADQIEAHRLERHLLTDAVSQLARPTLTPRAAPPSIVATTEVSIVKDDDCELEPAPTRLPDVRWQHHANETNGVLTSVQRLRQRAQKVWTRARAGTNGTGRSPSV